MKLSKAMATPLFPVKSLPGSTPLPRPVLRLPRLKLRRLPLLLHLGHPLRFYEILLTPQTSSAMAMFGFVYAWYLMAVLLLEIWFVFRADIIRYAAASTGLARRLYSVLALGVYDVSEEALRNDRLIREKRKDEILSRMQE